MKKHHIISSIGLALIIIGYTYIADEQSNLGGDIKLENPQAIEWDKPTTDAEWAEDVKKENFDNKSTGVLETMREEHAQKLDEFLTGEESEIIECPECVRYKLKRRVAEWTPKDMDEYGTSTLGIVNILFQNELENYNWEVEKLKQSVERMDKELELRDKGFVTVEGEDNGLLGALRRDVPPERIRKIHD